MATLGGNAMATKKKSRPAAKPKKKIKTKTAVRAKPRAGNPGARASAAKASSGKVKAARSMPKAPAAVPAESEGVTSLPNLVVETTGGQRLRLSDLKGQPVVLYFYPKDDTPGCTMEACDLRDNYDEFQSREVVVLGVSRDSPASHESFKTKHRLPFDLISDPDEKLCRAFGVIREKSLYGQQYLGIERSTFIFDKDGVLRQEFRGVKVPGHVAEILMELDSL
jgi:peroxiredoxin Q/BCP